MNSRHIIVVGGGVVGACTTYFLSRHEGIHVTLVEKTSIACGASGKAGGFLAYNWSDDTPIGDLSRKSFKLHGELAEKLDGASNYGYRAVDTYSVLYQTSGSKSSSSSSSTKKQKTSKLQVAWVDVSGIRHVEQLGNTADTAQVHPRLFTETLVEAAKATDTVTLRTGFGVSHVIINDDQAKGVKLDNGEIIEGDAVIVCMGPWSGQLPTLQLPIAGQRAHSIVFQPTHSVPPQALFTTILDGTRANHPEDGTVYMCGATDSEALPSAADQVQVDPKAIRELEQLRDTLAPELCGGSVGELIAQQACYLPVSQDGTPLVGAHPAYKQLVLATGHSCWGILQAPATGLMITELLIDGRITCVDTEAVEALDPINRC
ncbi:FAD dependent oxidoreductase [Zychaea mexicana]|uniref:FAD dependent oxidoreductase n=1 Tax=Zychaea mexicana TaxID=64656 RepID=UPI0022FF4101|nr:FAD dependent oxidoreductase [Zychaea mexicana]KAI9479557.1 FAD dependent oxidoreductase [Zychaea mexicana]